jgi:hypothetical protein
MIGWTERKKDLQEYGSEYPVEEVRAGRSGSANCGQEYTMSNENESVELTPEEQAEALWDAQVAAACKIFIQSMQELGLPLQISKRWGGKILDRVIELDLDATDPASYFRVYVDLQGDGYFADLQAEIEAEEAQANAPAAQTTAERIAERAPSAIRQESGLVTQYPEAETENVKELRGKITRDPKTGKHRDAGMSLEDLRERAIASRRGNMTPEARRAMDRGLRTL